MLTNRLSLLVRHLPRRPWAALLFAGMLLAMLPATSQAAVTFSRADFFAGENSFSVGVGDFNEDGDQDVVGAGGSSVVLLLGNGAGAFAPPASFPVGANP